MEEVSEPLSCSQDLSLPMDNAARFGSSGTASSDFQWDSLPPDHPATTAGINHQLPQNTAGEISGNIDRISHSLSAFAFRTFVPGWKQRGNKYRLSMSLAWYLQAVHP